MINESMDIPPDKLSYLLLQLVARMYVAMPEGTTMELDSLEVALISLADRTFNDGQRGAPVDVDDEVRAVIRSFGSITPPDDTSN